MEGSVQESPTRPLARQCCDDSRRGGMARGSAPTLHGLARSRAPHRLLAELSKGITFILLELLRADAPTMWLSRAPNGGQHRGGAPAPIAG